MEGEEEEGKKEGEKGRGEGEMRQEQELVRYETWRNDSKKNLRNSW